MCFAPKVSLTTAIVEFLIATYILLRSKVSFVVKFLVIFIYLLGFYQFTEFMLCTTGEAELWGTLGFLTYNVLPAVGLHFSIRCRGKKFNNWILYIFPIVFALTAVFTKDFVVEGTCSTVFVIVRTLFYRSVGSIWLTFFYWFYYFGYIFTASLLLLEGAIKEKSRKIKTLYIVALLAVVLSLGPAFIFIVLFPSLGMMFPSIYCEFAFLFSIAALVGVYLDEKIKRD